MLALILILAVALISGNHVTQAKTMTENEKHLSEARKRIEQFNSELEAVHLLEASQELVDVNLRVEHNTEVRRKLRSDALSLWLTLIKILDQKIDPEFDEKDVPPMLVDPPPVPGEVLRPGATPEKIADPTLRAEYEKAIEANRARQRNYRLQLNLKRLSERIPPQAEEFIKTAYSSGADEKEEVKAAVMKHIENIDRQNRLIGLLK
jgi:hypothetical protein